MALKPHYSDLILYPFSKKEAINRLVLAPMTNQQSHSNGVASDEEIRFLEMRALGGFGTIVTCAMYVQQDGKAWHGQMGISDEIHIPGLRKLTAALRRRGALSIAQLFHAGSRADAAVSGCRIWSASNVYHRTKGHKTADAATEEDIFQVIESFGKSAAMAAEAGFDGVEIHAAHGYLIHQFLSAATNQRNDAWGTTEKGRRRLLLHIVDAVQKQVKGHLIVGVRISPEDFSFFSGIDFDESLDTARTLVEKDIDYLDVSLWDALKKPAKYPDGAPAISYFAEITSPADTLLRTAGAISTSQHAEQVIRLGADLLAVGRAAISHHDLPHRWARAQHINPPPYSEDYLAGEGLSAPFIHYMKRWPNFVKTT